MPAKTKNTRFQYFKCLYLSREESGDEPYALEDFLEHMKGKTLKDRIFVDGDSKGRLENIENIDGNPNLYALRFMRLDDISDDYKVKEDGEAEHVGLEDDEYLGRATLAIYDATLCVLMLQRNKGGYTVSHIQAYINSVMEDKCIFEPISQLSNAEHILLDGGEVTSVELSFFNVEQCVSKHSTDYEEIIDAAKRMNSVSAYVRFGIGRKRGRWMDRSRTLNLIKDVGENYGLMNKAKMHITYDGVSEWYDMFDGLLRDEIKVTIKSRKELDFTETTKEMAKLYAKRLPGLLKP